MTPREYARHRGVYFQAVETAIRAGRITLRSDGKVDSDTADTQWQQTTDPARRVVAKEAGQILQAMRRSAAPQKKETPPPAQAAPPAEKSDDDYSDYAKSRAMRERYQAEMARLLWQQKKGELISRAEVRRIAEDYTIQLKMAALAVPDRIAAQLAAESDPAAVHHILDTELRRVLEQFADTQKSLAILYERTGTDG